jgi:hypothetical protein
MTEPKPKAVVLLLGLALVLPRDRVGAQFVSRLEASAVNTASAGDLSASTFSVTPGVQYSNSLLNLGARGSAWLTGQSWQFADGLVSGSVNTPVKNHLRADLTGNFSRAYYDRTTQNDQIDAQARVHLVFSQSGGMWLSTGVERPWRVAGVSAVDVAGAGVWTQVGGATITGTYTNFTFTQIASSHDSSSTSQQCAATLLAFANGSSSDCLRQSRYSDVQGSVHWEKSFLEVSGLTGYRFGDASDVATDSRRWASATVTAWMSRDVATVVGGGREPANPARGLPARTYAHLGFMFAAWPAMTAGNVPIEIRASAIQSFDFSAAGVSLQRLQVHIGGVQTVELMGDFTDWEPVMMVWRGRDLWEALLPIGIGVHEINVRVDGGKWQPPPGTPTMNDGFSGKVGVLVIQ